MTLPSNVAYRLTTGGSIQSWLQQTLGIETGTQTKILTSLLVIFVLWGLQRLVLAIAFRRVEDPRARYRWKRTSTYLAGPVALFVVGRIWFEGFQTIATFLGLLTAGVAIALKDLLVNLAAWAFIIWRRPFEVGDRIQIGQTAGDVIDARLFQFTILEIGNWVNADQSTGRIIHVPNGHVFTEPLANYTKGFQYLWNEIPVLVTFESHWQEAKAILTEIAQRHAAHLSREAEEQVKAVSRRFLIFYSTLTPTVYTSVVDSGILLTMRYLCEPRSRRGTSAAIWEEILQRFAEHGDIDFAYPTQRFYNNVTEGKPAARTTAAP